MKLAAAEQRNTAADSISTRRFSVLTLIGISFHKVRLKRNIANSVWHSSADGRSNLEWPAHFRDFRPQAYDHTTGSSPMTLSAGIHLGRYEIASKIGEGGVGE